MMKFFICFILTIGTILNITLVNAKFKIIRGVCPSKNPPLATVGDSCGTPSFVDQSIFGDNKDTTGKLWLKQRESGLDVFIKLENLPKPDLVLTAWIIWTPFGVTTTSIFKVANHASPCAAYNERFGTGIGRDPNELYYVSKTEAVLKTSLNFNPTFPNEGALTRETFSFQKDVKGIQSSPLKQFPTPGGTFIPVSSSYLRQYDHKTGFEKLDANGVPLVVPSPVKSLGIEVVAHVDKTTHGISQGVGGVDHYFLIFFPFEKSFGKPTKA